MNNFLHFSCRAIASGLGSGYAPKAPGTCGTLVALGCWYLLAHLGLIAGTISACVFFLILTGLGYVAVRFILSPSLNSDKDLLDPQWIVIDEWAGLALALVPAYSTNALHLLCAFLLFRMFDIIKPVPIRRLEQLPGAVGILADDIGAGALAGLALWLVPLVL